MDENDEHDEHYLIRRVRIRTSFAMIGISWDTSQQLRQRLRDAGATRVDGGFQRHGTSSPYMLDQADKAPLLAVAEAWVEEKGNAPQGITDLRDVLRAELNS